MDEGGKATIGSPAPGSGPEDVAGENDVVVRSGLFVLAILFLLSGCVTENDVRRDAALAREFAHFERVGAWVITCRDFHRKPDGSVLPDSSCSLRRTFNPETGEGGNALVVTAAYGRQAIVAPPGDRFCRVQPVARFVDDFSIRTLPDDRQIADLHTGRVYSEEYMPRRWPECWIVVRKARLDGFSSAHARFEAVAQARGLLPKPAP